MGNIWAPTDAVTKFGAVAAANGQWGQRNTELMDYAKTKTIFEA